MTELEFFKEFLNWLEEKGKVTDSDFVQFLKEFDTNQTVKKFIDDNFKGMF